MHASPEEVDARREASNVLRVLKAVELSLATDCDGIEVWCLVHSHELALPLGDVVLLCSLRPHHQSIHSAGGIFGNIPRRSQRSRRVEGWIAGEFPTNLSRGDNTPEVVYQMEEISMGCRAWGRHRSFSCDLGSGGCERGVR